MTESVIQGNVEQQDSQIERWVHQWGCSMSEAVLDCNCNFFRSSGIDGAIGYVIESDCAVVLSDPICPPEQMPELAFAFQKYCQEQSWNAIYVMATERFAKWAINNLCSILIESSEECVFDPQIDPTQGHKAQKLRNYFNHAQKLGLTVHEYFSVEIDSELENSLQNVADEWIRKRKGPQIHLGYLRLFKHRAYKRWFYIKHAEQFLGVAVLCKLEAKQGWLLKYLITLPEAPRGASELLMVSILEALRAENCRFLTNGILPLDHLGETQGLNAISRCLTKIAFNTVKWIFKLNQRKTFWRQFKPRTAPYYALLTNPKLGFKEIRAVLKAVKID